MWCTQLLLPEQAFMRPLKETSRKRTWINGLRLDIVSCSQTSRPQSCRSSLWSLPSSTPWTTRCSWNRRASWFGFWWIQQPKVRLPALQPMLPKSVALQLPHKSLLASRTQTSPRPLLKWLEIIQSSALTQCGSAMTTRLCWAARNHQGNVLSAEPDLNNYKKYFQSKCQ